MLEHLPHYFRKAIPIMICLLIILFSQIPDIRFTFVPLIFIPIFYFAIFRPALLNEYALFILGVLTDLISQTPFGLFSFIFVLMFFISRLNRLFFKELSFDRLWVLFSTLSCLMLLLELFLFSLCEGSVVYTKFLFQQATLLILFFPLGFNLCNRLNLWIGTDE